MRFKLEGTSCQRRRENYNERRRVCAAAVCRPHHLWVTSARRRRSGRDACRVPGVPLSRQFDHGRM